MNHVWSLLEDEKLSSCFSKSSLIDHCRRKQLINQPLWKMSRPLSTSWTCSPLENDTRGLAPDLRNFSKDISSSLEICPLSNNFFHWFESSKFCWKLTSSSPIIIYYQRRFHYVFHYESKIIICLHNNTTTNNNNNNVERKIDIFGEIEETRAKSNESVEGRVVGGKGKYLADVKQSSAPWRCVVYRYETNFDSAWIYMTAERGAYLGNTFLGQSPSS